MANGIGPFLTCVVSLLLIAQSTAHGQPTAKEIVASFLDETLSIDRLNKPHCMEFHVEYVYPDGTPEVYPLRSTYRRFAMPPKYRYEAVVGPFEPIGQDPVTYVTIWNGNAEVNAHYGPQGTQGGVTVARSGPSTDLAASSNYLRALGVACTAKERSQVDDSYFLRTAVNEENGYRVSPSTTKLDGLQCWVIQKDNVDRLWFSVTQPVRLIKRDVWKTSLGTPARFVGLYSEYRADGFPARVKWTRFKNVPRVGLKSRIKVVENLRLTEFDFKSTPEERFILQLEPGSQVLDIETMQSLRVATPGTPPFDKLLGVINAEATHQRSWWGTMNTFMKGGVFIAFVVMAILMTRRCI